MGPETPHAIFCAKLFSAEKSCQELISVRRNVGINAALNFQSSHCHLRVNP